jgi:hypothetical protein
MNNARTLEALGSILCPPGAAMNPPVPPKPQPASDEDLVAFMRWLHARSRRRTKMSLPRFDDPALRDLVPPELKEKVPEIARRIVMDIMKRPAPPGLSEPAGGGTRRRARPRRRPRKPARKPSARKPAARRRRRGG